MERYNKANMTLEDASVETGIAVSVWVETKKEHAYFDNTGIYANVRKGGESKVRYEVEKLIEAPNGNFCANGHSCGEITSFLLSELSLMYP